MYNHSYTALILINLQPIFTVRPWFIYYKADNNVSPRGNIEWMERSKKISPETIAMVKRLQGAERNSFDGLPLICAAIVAGNTAGLSASYLNTVSGLYLLSRIVYVWLYATITTKGASNLRSLCFWFGNFCSFVTLVKAGRAVNALRL